MKKIILFSVLFLTAVLLYSTPKIDCNGNTPLCETTEWQSAESYYFKLNDCWVTVSFSVMSCCSGSNPCEYIIDIQQVRTIGPCGLTDDEIKSAAFKFALSKTYEILDIPPFMLKTFHIKIPKCQGSTTFNYFGYSIKTLNACGTDCCLSELHVVNLGDKISIVNQIPYANIPSQCPTGPTGELCSYSCGIIEFGTTLPIDIYPYNTVDVCEADCFWRLDGNDNVTESNFIGPTNGQDFVIKTKNSVTGTLMERVKVDADNQIDFKLNAWNDLPQITFDADINASPSLHDPTIKIYRHTGFVNSQGKLTVTPWWISVNGLNGTNGWGAFNIWSSHSLNPAPSVGEEDANMDKVFTILPNGNVGIGVIEPRQKLVVNGMICASEVRVTLGGEPCYWPDYVFNDNYQLQSLEEIESFVKKNKHLPNIPSASEVAKNGVEIGDMQAKLLLKIEELTLHLIELKKENEEIKKLLKKE